MSVIFCICALLLFHVYAGYLYLLRLWKWLSGTPRRVFAPLADDALRTLTVLLTVYNEEEELAARLDDLLAQDYPRGKLQILIASDGSTDATDDIVRLYAQTAPVQLVRCERLGKSGAQNQAMLQVSGDIVALTDAQARFAPGYLRAIAAALADPRIGCVTAQLLFGDSGGTLAQGQGYYWSYELKLRQLESDLGILAVTSGQAMAFKKSLFVPMPLNVGDDCIIPLDIVGQGYLVVHQPDAIAHDRMEKETAREFRSRIRMVTRNWSGMWMRPGLLNFRIHPGYAAALWSHKLLRWLGSLCLVLMLLAAPGLILNGFWPALLMPALLAAALTEGLKESGFLRRSLPGTSISYGFLIANTGFLIGLLKAITGHKITAYRAGQ